MTTTTTKRCWVIVEGWERTGPLLGVRDTYEAAVLEAANRYVGQQFRVVDSVLDEPGGWRPQRHPKPVGGTLLEEAPGFSGDTTHLVRVGIWAAELRFLHDAEDGHDG